MNIYFENATKRYLKHYGAVVSSGPFSGMKYVQRAIGSMYIPKLVGSYEAELNDVIEYFSKIKYTTIIDVGCAEGYYAIGLARRNPSSLIYAFDIDGPARSLCTEMADLNGVSDQVFVAGECKHMTLTKLIDTNSLLIVDCEGAEYDLLDPQKVPQLCSTDMLVELHDFLNPHITPAIVKRFEATHKIKLIDAQKRDVDRYQALKALLGSKGANLMLKERDLVGQQWAVLIKR
jgi:hypothetical protein